MPDLAILGLFAHPDDEQLMSGTFARCAQEGMRTGLVCATRGEAGQIHESAEATPDNIGQVREAELRAAAVAVGVQNLWFLGYRDSGWMGTPDNEDPRSFNKCDQDEALGKIVRIVRDFKPTVMVTFDRTGGYGHLDHLMIHKLATEAFSTASDPTRYPGAGEPWQASRLFYGAFPRSLVQKFTELTRQMDPESDFGNLDVSDFGLPDDEITNEIDVSRWLALKEHSLQQHRTQRGDWERMAKMPRDILESIGRNEYFALGAGVPLPAGPEARGDLFAGLR